MPEQERPSFRRLNFAGVVPSGVLQLIVVDIICPYMVYPLLQPRLSPQLALALVALFPIASIVTNGARRRMLEPLGVVSLYVIACIMLGNYIVSISAYILYTLFIALAGLIMLATQRSTHPLAAYVERFIRTLAADQDGQSQENHDWSKNSAYNADMRKINAIWGLGQWGIALVLAGMISQTIQEALQDLLQFLVPLTIAIGYIALMVWTIQYRDSHLPSWQPAAHNEEQSQQQEDMPISNE